MIFLANRPLPSSGSEAVFLQEDEFWLKAAIDQANLAAKNNEVPVGAVIVVDGAQLSTGYNAPIAKCDPTCHAEVVAIRQAAKSQNNYRLRNATLYVTLEPCAMCLGAMIQARVKRLVFGAYDFKAGAVTSVFRLLEAPEINHRIIWQGGILEKECAGLLQDFFRARR